jgi:hypothetical protein
MLPIYKRNLLSAIPLFFLETILFHMCIKHFFGQEEHHQQHDKVYVVSLTDISRQKLAVERF